MNGGGHGTAQVIYDDLLCTQLRIHRAQPTNMEDFLIYWENRTDEIGEHLSLIALVSDTGN